MGLILLVVQKKSRFLGDPPKSTPNTRHTTHVRQHTTHAQHTTQTHCSILLSSSGKEKKKCSLTLHFDVGRNSDEIIATPHLNESATIRRVIDYYIVPHPKPNSTSSSMATTAAVAKVSRLSLIFTRPFRNNHLCNLLPN